MIPFFQATFDGITETAQILTERVKIRYRSVTAFGAFYVISGHPLYACYTFPIVWSQFRYPFPVKALMAFPALIREI